MDFSLRPHQLVAHWTPGFVLLGILGLTDLSGFRNILVTHPTVCHYLETNQAITLLAIAVAGFVIGEFLDTIRDLIDRAIDDGNLKCLDWIPKVDWKFLVKGEDSKVQRTDDYYFIYYVFQMNLVWVLVIGGPRLWVASHFSFAVLIGTIVVVAILFGDAVFLRKDMADIWPKPRK
jgi:hypothetical protein